MRQIDYVERTSDAKLGDQNLEQERPLCLVLEPIEEYEQAGAERHPKREAKATLCSNKSKHEAREDLASHFTQL